MKLILFSFLIILEATAESRFIGCGIFDIYGRIEKDPGSSDYMYVVNGGTNSSYRFRLNPDEEIMMAPYQKSSTKIRASIDRDLREKSEGVFSKIEKIEQMPSDYAYLNEQHGFLRVKEEKCQ